MPSRIEKSIRKVLLEASERLSADLKAERQLERALPILNCLVSDPRMQKIWRTLYKKKRVNHKPTDDYFYPAAVTNRSSAKMHRQQASELRKAKGLLSEPEAKLLEAVAAAEASLPLVSFSSSWDEQDQGVQWFFEHACRSAINIVPIFQSEIERYRGELIEEIAELRRTRDELVGLGLDSGSFNEYLAACEEDELTMPLPGTLETNWVIKRRRGRRELRTYAVSLSEAARSIFGSPLPGIVATVTRVVFACDEKEVTRETVQEWIK
jgi:hypothetical protein